MCEHRKRKRSKRQRAGLPPAHCAGTWRARVPKGRGVVKHCIPPSGVPLPVAAKSGKRNREPLERGANNPPGAEPANGGRGETRVWLASDAAAVPHGSLAEEGSVSDGMRAREAVPFRVGVAADLGSREAGNNDEGREAPGGQLCKVLD